jgi:hypothetical protein
MDRAETRRRMTALVRRWKASPDTQEVFTRRHGISRAKLHYWMRQVAPPQATVAFTPVQVCDSLGAETGAVEIALATGERVVVRAGTSPALVRMVVSALRSAC